MKYSLTPIQIGDDGNILFFAPFAPLRELNGSETIPGPRENDGYLRKASAQVVATPTIKRAIPIVLTRGDSSVA